MNLWELNESHLLSGQHAGLIQLYLFLFLNHIELFFLLVLIDVSYVIHLISENYMRFVLGLVRNHWRESLKIIINHS